MVRAAGGGGISARILDLFCGAGGCAVGYHRAGFEVVGVDILDQPNYPFEFRQADALELLSTFMPEIRGWWDEPPFAAIHASPPCQAYTTMNNRHASKSPPMIGLTRSLLESTGLPWVIENVPGARSELGPHPIRLTGEMFGLGVHRPRLFQTNWPIMAIPAPPRQRDPVAVYGKHDQRRLWTRVDGSELRCANVEEAQEAMGIDWMDWDEIREAVPPAFTEFVGHQLAGYLLTAAATAE